MKKLYTYLAAAFCMLALPQILLAQTISGSYSVQCTAYKQEQTQWCWAAATRMVDWTYSSVTPPSQCTIVNRANNACDLGSCCSNLNTSRPSACTSPLSSNYPNNMYGCNGSLGWLINAYAGANTGTGSSLSYSTVSNNLYNNKMMVARWGWSGGGGHFVVIYGCYQFNYAGQVSYANPSSGSKVTESHAYFTSNSSRTWTHSITMNGAAYRPRYANPDAFSAAESNIKLYPNPTGGQFMLLRTGDLEAPVEVSITNTLGSTVFETVIRGGQAEVSLDLKNELSAGVYLINLSENGQKHTEKLIVQ